VRRRLEASVNSCTGGPRQRTAAIAVQPVYILTDKLSRFVHEMTLCVGWDIKHYSPTRSLDTGTCSG